MFKNSPLYVFVLLTGILITYSSCTNRVRGCMDPNAVNFNSDAERDDGTCTYIREFYTDDSIDGWVDIWVAEDTSSDAEMVYEGRITESYPTFPDCGDSGLVQVVRQEGEYWVEYETQNGFSAWLTVIYRDGPCRLSLVD